MQHLKSDYYEIICHLGIMNQQLISRSLGLGLIHDAHYLKQIDEQLLYLLKQARPKFDFTAHIAGRNALLVGEGNLSFALSLSKRKVINPRQLTTSTYEIESQLSDLTLANAASLRKAGATVLHGVNAWKLDTSFGSQVFDHIIFQFPHVGSREPIRGHNPNFVLVRDFLKSASKQLAANGTVMISAVDTPHYHGAFQFGIVAANAGFQPPEVYIFDPDDFPDYTHTMTHQDGDALTHHDTFATWVFKRG